MTGLSDRQAKGARALLERLREKAATKLGDRAFVEKTVDAAERRVERHAELRRTIDPLARLVVSYVRGTYRAPAPASDVALALAALLYVASPIDLFPDYYPGGLQDDEAVVAWTAEHIAHTLDAYEEWEQDLGGGDAASTGSGHADVVTQLESLDVDIIGPVDSLLFTRTDLPRPQTGPPVAIGPAVTAVSSLRTALEAGQCVRVLGPTPLLEGLKSQNLELMHSVGGNLGVVRDASSKQIEGHLRLGDIQSTGIGAPALAVFQIASAVTLQYYLARIDRQLGEIQDMVALLRQDNNDRSFAVIETARARCATVEEAEAAVGAIGHHDAQQLHAAAQDLDVTYNTLRSSLESFCLQAESLDIETVEKADLKKLLVEGATTKLTDAQLLLFASVVRHRLHGLQVLLHRDEPEARTILAIDELHREQTDMLALLNRVRAAFQLIHVPKRKLNERWGVVGGPERELQSYVESSNSLRRHLAAPPEILPPFMPAEPFLMEMRLDEEGALETQWADLRPAQSHTS